MIAAAIRADGQGRDLCACGALGRSLPFYAGMRAVIADVNSEHTDELTFYLENSRPGLLVVDEQVLDQVERRLGRTFQRLMSVTYLNTSIWQRGESLLGARSAPRAARRPRPESMSGAHPESMSGGTRRLVAFLAVAFVLRLAFGLAFDFWGDDEFQIYLIGLKYYTTGAWPLYGPDVVYTETRLPGGMQGLLVGGPFWIAPWPEAPYILLNALSLGALALLAWYIGRRLPDLPRWFLWIWVFFSPWTLDISAHIINTSYAILGAIVFCRLGVRARAGAACRRRAQAARVLRSWIRTAVGGPVSSVRRDSRADRTRGVGARRARGSGADSEWPCLVRCRGRAREPDHRTDASSGWPRRGRGSHRRERRVRAGEPAETAADRRPVPVSGHVRSGAIHGPSTHDRLAFLASVSVGCTGGHRGRRAGRHSGRHPARGTLPRPSGTKRLEARSLRDDGVSSRCSFQALRFRCGRPRRTRTTCCCRSS